MDKLFQVTLTVVSFYVANSQKMGPFKIIVNHIESCSKEMRGETMVFEPKLKKYNRTTFSVEGPVSFTHDIDDSLDVSVKMSLLTNNGWKENFFQQTWKKGCTTMMTLVTDTFRNFCIALGLKPGCPIKKGNYTLRDLPLATTMNTIPAFFYNKYKFHFRAHEKSRNYLCFTTMADVVPKNRKV